MPAAASAAIFGITLITFVGLAVTSPMGYILATYENLYGEWLQVFLFAAAMVLSLRVVTRTGHPYRWFFALLGLACFYVVGEEVSWGQQVFDWDSPAFFESNNLQGETNLHNMVTGPFSTWLKQAIEWGLAIALVGYGLIYPVAIRRGFGPATWLEARGLAGPPVHLWPFWALGAVLELGPLRFNEAEVAEVLISFALAATALHHAVLLPRGAHPHQPASWGDARSMLGGATLGVSVLCLILAVGATQAMFSVPETRERMERRIQAGVEKFAGRYARFDQHATAAALYGKALERDPRDRALLRKYAVALQKDGRAEEAVVPLEKAIELDRAKLRGSPTSASAHRSLVRSFRLSGDVESAERHLAGAFRIARTRVADHPDSANAHYALGRAHELAEEWALALGEFELAAELDPGRKRNRKAVHRMRGKVAEDG